MPATLSILLALGLAASASAQGDYASELQARARELRLHEDKAWLTLLHFRRGMTGRRGEARAPEFYAHPRGRKDSAAELEATLKAFFAPPAADPNDPHLGQHPQCLFAARYHWLKGKLAFDPKRLSEQACPAFERWRSSLDPASVTLVFASAFVNSPASMYGHTFLRFDKKGHGGGERLLDYTLNYAAQANDSNGLLYALKGLFGFYRGSFSVLPFYVKVQEYTNMESRDLWEYPLKLSQEQMDQLVRHAWELGSAWFPYHFFNTNCSYQLLPLLDASGGDFRLARWRPGVIPSDTVRWIRAAAGGGEPRLRQSRLSLMQARRAPLEGEERKLAYRAALGDADAALKEIAARTPERQALLLDAASDLIVFKHGPDPDIAGGVKERERALFSMRKKIDAKPVEAKPGRWDHPPDAGHRTARVGYAFGWTNKSTFEEWSGRFALHDELDAPKAYAFGGKLEMGAFRLRYDNKATKLYLQEATLIDITSLTPWDPWVRQASWRARFGVEAADELDRAAYATNIAAVRLSRGYTVGTEWGRRQLFYALAEASAGAGNALRDSYRLGGGGSAGVLWDASEFFRMNFEAAYIAYPLGHDGDYYALRLGAQYDLSERLALRGGVERRGLRKEATAGLLWYF